MTVALPLVERERLARGFGRLVRLAERPQHLRNVEPRITHGVRCLGSRLEEHPHALPRQSSASWFPRTEITRAWAVRAQGLRSEIVLGRHLPGDRGGNVLPPRVDRAPAPGTPPRSTCVPRRLGGPGVGSSGRGPALPPPDRRPTSRARPAPPAARRRRRRVRTTPRSPKLARSVVGPRRGRPPSLGTPHAPRAPSPPCGGSWRCPLRAPRAFGVLLEGSRLRNTGPRSGGAAPKR